MERLRQLGWPVVYNQSDWARVDAKVAQDVKQFLAAGMTDKHFRGIYICGGIGTGKSCLLALIARFFAMYYPFNPQFISVSQLFDMYFERNYDRVNALMQSTLLFLDDLGTEYSTDFPLAKFSRMMEYRYSHLYPTFVTSNLLLKDLKAIPGFERIADRFSDPLWMRQCVVTGSSKRGKATT